MELQAWNHHSCQLLVRNAQAQAPRTILVWRMILLMRHEQQKAAAAEARRRAVSALWRQKEVDLMSSSDLEVADTT